MYTWEIAVPGYVSYILLPRNMVGTGRQRGDKEEDSDLSKLHGDLWLDVDSSMICCLAVLK